LVAKSKRSYLNYHNRFNSSLRYNARRKGGNTTRIAHQRGAQMKSTFFLILLIFTCIFINPVIALVQEPVDGEVIAKIKDEATKRSQVEETFTHFTEDIGPRLTGTPAQKQAAEYAATR